MSYSTHLYQYLIHRSHCGQYSVIPQQSPELSCITQSFTNSFIKGINLSRKSLYLEHHFSDFLSDSISFFSGNTSSCKDLFFWSISSLSSLNNLFIPAIIFFSVSYLIVSYIELKVLVGSKMLLSLYLLLLDRTIGFSLVIRLHGLSHQV